MSSRASSIAVARVMRNRFTSRTELPSVSTTSGNMLKRSAARMCPVAACAVISTRSALSRSKSSATLLAPVVEFTLGAVLLQGFVLVARGGQHLRLLDRELIGLVQHVAPARTSRDQQRQHE